jgi:Putative peptidase family
MSCVNRNGRHLGVLLCVIYLVVCPMADVRAADTPAVQITNLTEGTTLRYPLVLLRGRLTDTEQTALVCINRSSDRSSREIKGVADKGRFLALVELVPGENRLVVRAGKVEQMLTLTYLPQTNPFVVRVIYMTDRTGQTKYETPVANDPQDYENKLDTGLKLLQCFTAERMNDLGLGRHTFNLEFDNRGRVKVHTLKGDLRAEEYYNMADHDWYRLVYEWSARQLPMDRGKNLVIPAYTRFDAASGKTRGWTALGGGGLALFSSSGLFTWPSTPADVMPCFSDARLGDGTRIHDDSAYRSTWWGMASTTLGSTLHELGHTFDLPHSKEKQDIMTRGFDRINRVFTLVEPISKLNAEPMRFEDNEQAVWAPISGRYLKASRWFALDDRTWTDQGHPTIRVDHTTNELVIQAPNGLRYVGMDVRGEAVDYLAYWNGSPPKEVRLKDSEVTRRTHTTSVHLRLIDNEGLTANVDVRSLLEARSFVRSWRIAAEAPPWLDRTAFLEVDANRLKEIITSAERGDLVLARKDFVEFGPQFPERLNKVAGYAVRKIHTAEARKVKILAGSSDALRVWVNGKLVIESRRLRIAKRDEDSVVVELAAGTNTLVVEVSQVDGDWGFYLRLEDETGQKLHLTDQDELGLLETAEK